MAFSSGTRTLIGEAVGWIGCAAILAVGLWHFDEIKAHTTALLGHPPAGQLASRRALPTDNSVATGSRVELRAGPSGHFHVEAEVNGRSVPVMVDTGATMVALSYEDAESAGIYLRPQDFTHGVNTANGRARVAPVQLDRVSIGDITVRNVRAVVSERGRLSTSLLGMSFLSRLSRAEMRSGTLELED